VHRPFRSHPFGKLEELDFEILMPRASPVRRSGAPKWNPRHSRVYVGVIYYGFSSTKSRRRR
jgi:hypothetical protein